MNPIVVTILVKERQADMIREAKRRQLAYAVQRKRKSPLRRYAAQLQALVRPNRSEKSYQQADIAKATAGCTSAG
jgi:hypothetical protein